jgi:hypothetical protein
LKLSLPEVAPRIRPPDRFRRDRHRGVTERISVMGLGRAGEGSTRFIPLARTADSRNCCFAAGRAAPMLRGQ